MGLLSGPASLLGIGDDHGDYYHAAALNNKGTKSLAEMLAAARGDKVNSAGMGLVNGGSLADALKGMNGDEASALGSSGIYGNVVASQQAANDPLLSGLIGKGGSRDQALAEEQRLSTQGFKLTPEDREAYGQASGDIARQFGQQEQSLASALSNRGLAAGGSGAGAAQFSGLQGNKNEQLAAMQTKIANDRMTNTMNRLKDVRAYSAQLGNLGLNAEKNMFDNNRAGNNDRTGLAKDLASNERADYDSQAAQDQASMTSRQGAEKQNLGDALASGMYQGVEAGTGAGIAGVLGGKKKTPGSDVTGAGGTGGAVGGDMGGQAGQMAMLAAMSDRNVKTNIEELFSVPVFSYTYKNAEHGKGLHASPMAQDLEATELGKSAVFSTPDGKAVDYAKLCGLMFTQLVLLTKEVATLKGTL